MRKWKIDSSSCDETPIPVEPLCTIKSIAAANNYIDRILMLPSSAFWSTLVHRKEIIIWNDEIIDWLPRPYDLDRKRALVADFEMLKATRTLRASALALFLRIAVYDKSKDTSMSPSDWVQATRDHHILPLERFSRWTVSFAPPHDAKTKRNRSILARALESAAGAEGARISEELINLEGEQIEELDQLSTDVTRLSSAFEASRGTRRAALAEIVERTLLYTVDWLYSAMSFYRIAAAAKLKWRPAKLVPAIANAVERMRAFLTTETTQEVAMMLDDYPIRRLFRLRTQLEQFGVELVNDLLAATPEDRRYDTVQQLLTCERFAYILNERYPVEKLKFSREQMANVEKNLRSITDKQKNILLTDMERLGLLKNLGKMTSIPSDVAVAIDEVLAILPHLTPAYVHMCLRHTGYDSAEAIDMIMCDRVPGWIRRADTVARDGWMEEKGGRGRPLPPIVFDHEDCNLADVVHASTSSASDSNGKKDDEVDTKNLFKGIFSLSAAPKKEEPSTSTKNNTPSCALITATSTAISSVRDGLERLKVRAHGEDAAFGMENERLVEMKTSKTYVNPNKYKTTAEDKAALRPFYERFKYETDERDEDVYNDEYDDAYEEKAYATDPLATNDVPATIDEKVEEEKAEQQQRSSMNRGGSRGGGSTRGGRGGSATSGAPQQQPVSGGGQGVETGGGSSRPANYTGGRDRQYAERNKNKFRQRGADRKARGGMQ